eukprot:COSAG06_NODE_1351_length_9765_cov_3.151976_9_plen_139_part_00
MGNALTKETRFLAGASAPGVQGTCNAGNCTCTERFVGAESGRLFCGPFAATSFASNPVSLPRQARDKQRERVCLFSAGPNCDQCGPVYADYPRCTDPCTPVCLTQRSPAPPPVGSRRTSCVSFYFRNISDAYLFPEPF